MPSDKKSRPDCVACEPTPADWQTLAISAVQSAEKRHREGWAEGWNAALRYIDEMAAVLAGVKNMTKPGLSQHLKWLCETGKAKP